MWLGVDIDQFLNINAQISQVLWEGSKIISHFDPVAETQQ